MKRIKERVIFDNYDLWENYAECARENLIENGIPSPSESDIWDEIYEYSSQEWEDALCGLKDYMEGKTWIAFGSCGLWYGRVAAGTIFTDFEEFFCEATKDCDYWKIYDENGHLYLKCFHHDGTNFYEIKEVTDRGVEYLQNWEYNYSDKRTEEYVHKNIMERYSRLPRYAEKEWGCKRVEYEKEEAA